MYHFSYAFPHLQNRALRSSWLLISLIACSISNNLFGQWDGNPKTVDNPIFLVNSNVVAVSDDAGGAIVVISSYSYLLAQRKSVTGQLLWNTLEAPIMLFNGTSITLSDVQKDGKGGAYIAYTNVINSGSADLYLQRLDSNGHKLFGENGIKVNGASSPVNYRGKLSVGKNGVTIVWGNTLVETGGVNDSTINNARLYIQRFDETGAPLWPQILPVSVAPAGRMLHVAVPDGKDGTYVIFTDLRNVQKTVYSWGDYYSNFDIYMQYFDSLGQRKWGSTDSALSVQPGDQVTYQDTYSEKTAIPDSNGGFEIVYLNGNSLCAQRVNANGNKSWPVDFNIGNPYGDTKYGIQAMSDGAGGLVASWFKVAPSDPFIFAQRVSAGGTLPWGPSAITINSPGDVQNGNPAPTAMVVDNHGDYVFSWYNSGTDTTNPDNPYLAVTQLKSQKISATGQKAWKPGGVIVYQSADNSADVSLPQLVASAENKEIVIWSNISDSYPNGRITSAMINPDGILYDNLVRISETIKNGDWSDPAIWADGKVPSQLANIIIKTNVAINQDVTCKSLKAVPPGAVTVNAGFIITITGP